MEAQADMACSAADSSQDNAAGAGAVSWPLVFIGVFWQGLGTLRLVSCLRHCLHQVESQTLRLLVLLHHASNALQFLTCAPGILKPLAAVQFGLLHGRLGDAWLPEMSHDKGD